ncbi:metal ABC transporter solute-binding protein, Zn/Mn family, partial [Staphylococcus saprophyticus]|uniref:metal ABC transporter solute-binding protein, Zn/Mn family n=1 Tax=Staphylococcus saprophyticus TaxID=29385 RepID=UPI0011AAD763
EGEEGDEEEDEDEGDDEEEGRKDGDIWVEGVVKKKMVKGIKDELVKKDSGDKGYYEKGYKEVIGALDDINDEMK